MTDVEFHDGRAIQGERPRVERRHFSITVPFAIAPFQNAKIEESFEMVDLSGISQVQWDHEVENFKNQVIYKAKRLREQIRKEMEE
jgi:hypothetical protein